MLFSSCRQNHFFNFLWHFCSAYLILALKGKFHKHLSLDDTTMYHSTLVAYTLSRVQIWRTNIITKSFILNFPEKVCLAAFPLLSSVENVQPTTHPDVYRRHQTSMVLLLLGTLVLLLRRAKRTEKKCFQKSLSWCSHSWQIPYLFQKRFRDLNLNEILFLRQRLQTNTQNSVYSLTLIGKWLSLSF